MNYASFTTHGILSLSHLKKIAKIVLLLFGIAILILIAVTIFIATKMGKRANADFNKDNGIKIEKRVL